MTKVSLSIWHSQDPLSILYMLYDRQSIECFDQRLSLCLRFLASSFQHLEAMHLRYFFCDATLCATCPTFQNCVEVSLLGVEEFFIGYSTLGSEYTTPCRNVLQQTPSDGAHSSFYSVGGSWIDECGGLLA